MDTEMNAARLLVYFGAWLLQQRKDATLAAAEAKMFATEACLKVVDEVTRIYGANAFARRIFAPAFLPGGPFSPVRGRNARGPCGISSEKPFSESSDIVLLPGVWARTDRPEIHHFCTPRVFCAILLGKYGQKEHRSIGPVTDGQGLAAWLRKN